jgi:hypothetical protein
VCEVARLACGPFGCESIMHICVSKADSPFQPTTRPKNFYVRNTFSRIGLRLHGVKRWSAVALGSCFAALPPHGVAPAVEPLLQQKSGC